MLPSRAHQIWNKVQEQERTENWPQQASKTRKGGIKKKNLTTGIQILLPPDPESPPLPCNRSEQWVNISKYGDQNSKGCQKKKKSPFSPWLWHRDDLPLWSTSMSTLPLLTYTQPGHRATHNHLQLCFGGSWHNGCHCISVPYYRCTERFHGSKSRSCCCSTPATNLSHIPQLTSRKPPRTTFWSVLWKLIGKFRLWL